MVVDIPIGIYQSNAISQARKAEALKAVFDEHQGIDGYLTDQHFIDKKIGFIVKEVDWDNLRVKSIEPHTDLSMVDFNLFGLYIAYTHDNNGEILELNGLFLGGKYINRGAVVSKNDHGHDVIVNRIPTFTVKFEHPLSDDDVDQLKEMAFSTHGRCLNGFISEDERYELPLFFFVSALHEGLESMRIKFITHEVDLSNQVIAFKRDEHGVIQRCYLKMTA